MASKFKSWWDDVFGVSVFLSLGNMKRFMYSMLAHPMHEKYFLVRLHTYRRIPKSTVPQKTIDCSPKATLVLHLPIELRKRRFPRSKITARPKIAEKLSDLKCNTVQYGYFELNWIFLESVIYKLSVGNYRSRAPQCQCEKRRATTNYRLLARLASTNFVFRKLSRDHALGRGDRFLARWLANLTPYPRRVLRLLHSLFFSVRGQIIESLWTVYLLRRFYTCVSRKSQ